MSKSRIHYDDSVKYSTWEIIVMSYNLIRWHEMFGFYIGFVSGALFVMIVVLIVLFT